MRYVTIIDIANELGISKSTVSRALSQTDHSVKRETRELIVETARRMGYHRNDMAVNLRKQHTKIIGISIPDASTPFFMTFTHFAQMELKKRGYHTIVVEAAEDYTTEREYLHMLVQSRVDGILVSACHKDKNLDLYRDILWDTYARASDVPGFNAEIRKLALDKEYYEKYASLSHYVSEFYSKEHVGAMWREYYVRIFEKWKDNPKKRLKLGKGKKK